MTRSLLTLLLLLHYLLVVCLSASIGADQPPARPFAYVHSHDCQVKNAWRGGECFEDCNGVQYQARKAQPSLPQLLATLKGVDLHCLPTTLLVAPALGGGGPVCWSSEREPGVLTGIPGRIDAPPCRG